MPKDSIDSMRLPSWEARSFWGQRADLYEKLDRKISSFAKNELGLEAVNVPSMLPQTRESELNYDKTFRGHLTFASGGMWSDSAQSRALSPAACLNIYPLLCNELAAARGATARVSVFRFEDGHHDVQQRMWEFEVRELVFIGTVDYVDEQLSRLLDWSIRLFNGLGVQVNPVAATDYFTGLDRQVEILRSLGRAKQNKTELITAENVALASFNKHDRHFLNVIDRGNVRGQSVTGCAGFGLARCVDAIASSGSELPC